MEKQLKIDFTSESMSRSGKNKPIKKFSAGSIKITIWNNKAVNDKGMETEYKTISFERLYKDRNNEWKSTNSLRVNDIPKAVLALNKAYEYLNLKE